MYKSVAGPQAGLSLSLGRLSTQLRYLIGKEGRYNTLWPL